MEFRILEYFLVVAREENITKAAEELHITQPTLSRQLLDLEKELGKKLFVRGKRKTQLTEDGWLLRKRAIEIVEMVSKAKSEISYTDNIISGDIYIGGGETEGMRFVAKTANSLQENHPLICVHLYSGNSVDVLEKLDRGLLDFGLIIGLRDMAKYDVIRLPFNDVFGLLMRNDSSLASSETISPMDIVGIPIITAGSMLVRNAFSAWFGKPIDLLNIVGTYNMIYNAALMVEEGVGYALTIKGLTQNDSGNLCFRPFAPSMQMGVFIARKKQKVFSRASELFYKELQSFENLYTTKLMHT